MASNFMVPEFYEGPWAEVDGSYGSCHFPDDGDSDATWVDAWCGVFGAPDDAQPEITRHKHGVLCRLSAPGYMDCTEWAAFETREAAEEFLAETYGDET